MPRRNDISRILIITLLIGHALLGHNQATSQTVKPNHALGCGADFDRAAKRIFANANGKGWKEYASIRQVPVLDGSNGEQLVVVKSSVAGSHYVETEMYGEDSAHYQQSCYDRDGALRSLHYEMRTAWGWGYDEVRRLSNSGKLVYRSNYFFETSSNQKITRPAQASEVPDFLKPEIYKTFGSLPITGAFERKANATPQ